MLTLDNWNPRIFELYSDGFRLWADPETWDGRKFGRYGLDTLIVILLGRGDTDLNHTTLLGITWSPTSMETGSPGGIIRDWSRRDTLILG